MLVRPLFSTLQLRASPLFALSSSSMKVKHDSPSVRVERSGHDRGGTITTRCAPAAGGFECDEAQGRCKDRRKKEQQPMRALSSPDRLTVPLHRSCAWLMFYALGGPLLLSAVQLTLPAALLVTVPPPLPLDQAKGGQSGYRQMPNNPRPRCCFLLLHDSCFVRPFCRKPCLTTGPSSIGLELTLRNS